MGWGGWMVEVIVLWGADKDPWRLIYLSSHTLHLLLFYKTFIYSQFHPYIKNHIFILINKLSYFTDYNYSFFLLT